MARLARTQSPTDYYHIMVRGNNKEEVFKNPVNKRYFIETLSKQEEEGLIEIGAYCIMDNHAHILIWVEIEDLGKVMKCINTKYALQFNYINDRVGHVFQGRYRSEVITGDEHLLNVLRYIHNNPVKAGIVGHPRNYKWSSYNEYLRGDGILTNCQRELVMSYFNEKKNSFIDFHGEYDENEYLDTQEDIQMLRLNKSIKIISQYLMDNGLEKTELETNMEHLEGIVTRLLVNKDLSHRQIADLLNVGRGIVHRISRQNKNAPGTVPNALEG